MLGEILIKTNVKKNWENVNNVANIFVGTSILGE